MIDASQIRAQSRKKARALGYALNDSLPLLEGGASLRSARQVTERMLGLSAVVYVAHDYPRSRALRWLTAESLLGALSESERAYLKAKPKDRRIDAGLQYQAESLWAFAWCGGLAPELDFGANCPETTVKLFPDMRVEESSAEFRKRIVLRDRDSILGGLDRAYCLHWAIQDAMLHQRRPPGRIHPLRIIERRRALEWILSESDWDAISLDT